MRSLAGIIVLDCTRVLAGPYCTMLLGDLGADVIKVEQPGRGDETRAWGPPFVAGESPYFWAANRNKRSLTLDLGQAEGRAIFAGLVARCHVLVENFKRGTLERWGFDDAALWRLRPGLVHTAISAYGPTGPRAEQPGYDFLLQAESGWMSITGEPDGQPMKAGVALVDVLTGLYASNATLAALRHAEATGQGQRVDCSLFQSAVAALANVGSTFLATGRAPQRWGNAHATIVPYQLFETADQPIVLAVGNDRQWRRCCAALELPELAQRFATNPERVAARATLIPLLERQLATRTAEEWLAALGAAQVPAAPVRTLPQVFDDPQAAFAGLQVPVEHPGAGVVQLPGLPFTLSATPADVRLPPPLLGQHTAEVLLAAGHTQSDIERWQASGVI